MITRLQRGSLAPSQPSWLRALALFCLLLIAGTSTAQAAHVHGDWLPHSAKHAGLPAAASQNGGEEHCPLCVAMHSAMPATLHLVYVPAVRLLTPLVVGEVRAAEARWGFALFSRPPPVQVPAMTAG